MQSSIFNLLQKICVNTIPSLGECLMSTWNWTQFLNQGQRFLDLKKHVKIETVRIKMWKNYDSMWVDLL